MAPPKTDGLSAFNQRHRRALVQVQPLATKRTVPNHLPRTLERFNRQTKQLVPPASDRLEKEAELREEIPQLPAAPAHKKPASKVSRRAVSLDQLVEDYLIHLGDQRCTVATLRWHRYHLTQFCAWARAHAPTPYPADWAEDDEDRLLVRRYLSEVGRQTTTRGRQRSAASLKSIQSSLRSFCRWLYATGRTSTDLLAGTSSPRLPETLKETFSPEEIERLLAAAIEHSRYPLRDVALIRFMLDTGCCAAEVCSLRATEIDWAARQAKVIGKGRKERFVFFSEGVAEAMRRYGEEERRGHTAYFFESEANRGGRPLTPSGLLSLCKRLGHHAGVHVNPHKFRHTFAIAYLRTGGDVFALQKRLGHSQLAMSEHYAKHVTEDLRREHDEHSPDAFYIG